jgi:Zn-dependent protease
MKGTGERRPEVAATGWKISASFLVLLAAFLGSAVVMVMQPNYERMALLVRAALFAFVLTGWLISVCLHEFGHAVAAYAGGDHGVRDKGYLTLDPLRYTNFQYSIVWPLVFLVMGGIGLPGAAVYVDTRALRGRAWRSLMSAAGPFATLAMLLILIAILRAGGFALGINLYMALAVLALLQLTALVLNLLPVPGLDGWGIIEPWLPGTLRHGGNRLRVIGPALLFLLFFLVPVANDTFWRAVFALGRAIDLDRSAALLGLHLFQFWQ